MAVTIFDVIALVEKIHRGNSEVEVKTRKLLFIIENMARKMSNELLKQGVVIQYKKGLREIEDGEDK